MTARGGEGCNVESGAFFVAVTELEGVIAPFVCLRGLAGKMVVRAGGRM